jgi:hypothetical protein
MHSRKTYGEKREAMSGEGTDRKAILSRYRERIRAGQRTRLTKGEQDDLVNAFITDLAKLDSPKAIEARCREELTLLEEGYSQQTVSSRMLAPYRKAMQAAVADGTLPLNDHTSHIARHTKRTSGEVVEVREHWGLTHLKYDMQTYERLRESSTATNNARQDALQPIQVDPYLAAVTQMLTEHDPHVLTAAIAAATGRRHTEVALRGTFEPTEHPYVLRFSGQQKKRDGTSPTFEIVTIVPAQHVLDALAHLRAHPSVRAMEGISSVQASEIRAFNVQVNRVVKQRFEESGIVPRIKGARSVSVHRLRGVYAAIAVYLWCPEGQHEHRFIQHYLGHVHKDAREPNSEASSHYFHYRLLDGDGEPLHAKGILLPSFGPPPEQDTTEQDMIEAPTQPHAPTQAMQRPRLPRADLERLQALTERLGSEGSPASRLHALLDWAEAHQADQPGNQLVAAQASPQTLSQAQDTLSGESTPTAASTAPAMTAESTLRPVEEETRDTPPSTPPSADVLRVVDHQAQTLAWLTEEISTTRQEIANMRQQLTQAEQARMQVEAQARDARAELSLKQARIDSLTAENANLRKRLERMESIRRALAGMTDTELSTASQDAPEASQSSTETPKAAEPRRTVLDIPAAHTEPAERLSKPSRGQARIDRIWQVVQDWNNTPGRPQHEKVALTLSVLSSRFNVFRNTIHAWLEHHQHEIDRHNQTHGIKPSLNRNVPQHVWQTLINQARA